MASDDLQITGIRFQFFIDIFETFGLLEEDAEFPVERLDPEIAQSIFCQPFYLTGWLVGRRVVSIRIIGKTGTVETG